MFLLTLVLVLVFLGVVTGVSCFAGVIGLPPIVSCLLGSYVQPKIDCTLIGDLVLLLVSQ